MFKIRLFSDWHNTFYSFSLIAHVDSLTLAIIPAQSRRANEIYDFSDNQQFRFGFRKYIVRVYVLTNNIFQA